MYCSFPPLNLKAKHIFDLLDQYLDCQELCWLFENPSFPSSYIDDSSFSRSLHVPRIILEFLYLSSSLADCRLLQHEGPSTETALWKSKSLFCCFSKNKGIVTYLSCLFLPHSIQKGKPRITITLVANRAIPRGC